MSYLSRPRIGFFSLDASTNPSTANNENVIHFLDYQHAKLFNPPVVDGPQLPAMGHAAYREWMTTLLTYSDPLPNPGAAPGPGNSPDWQPGMPGYWNYWGDHMTSWGRAQVNSLTLEGDAEPVTSAGTDSLFGASVVWHARIVDVDPADTWSTQFVASGFSIIGRDASGDLAELVSGLPTTSYTRWLNFFRYMGAGTFQSVVPSDALTFIDDARAPDSDAFRALRDGARAGGGLLLRYCFYGMRAASTQAALYDDLSAGGRQVNPKVGRVLGTIGVWNGTDMSTTPVGRVLQQPGPPFFSKSDPDPLVPVPVALNVRTHGHVEQLHTPGTQLNDESQLLQCIQSMGPAVAVVQDGAVVLDLLTAFPEIGCDPNATGDPFAKHDFGPVTLDVVWTGTDGSKSSAPLGPVSYDASTYERLAGVWEVPIDPASPAAAHIGDGWLQLSDADGNVLLQEIEVAQVETDDRGIYLDLAPGDGAGTPTATGELTLRAFVKGEPITAPLDVEIQFWVDVMTPGAVNSVNPLVIMACSLNNAAAAPGAYTVLDAGVDGKGAFHVTVPAGGELPLRFTADTAGCFKLRFLPPGMDPTQPPAFAVEYYTNVRALPFEDYSNVPDEDLTFEFIFDEVLAYFSILYPVMSAIIPWGPDNTPHDPDRVAQFAALMSMAVDESRLGTALQMPITRDLSAGKRKLLQRWCALQMQATDP